MGFDDSDPQVENGCYSQWSRLRRVQEASDVLPKPGSVPWDSQARLQLNGCVALQTFSEGMHASFSPQGVDFILNRSVLFFGQRKEYVQLLGSGNS